MKNLTSREYPEVITEQQIERTRLNKRRIYCFGGLSLKKIKDFYVERKLVTKLEIIG